ncbi:MAG TPA: hypothetical protein VF884_02510 [Nitrososphaeraceae archaeon]
MIKHYSSLAVSILISLIVTLLSFENPVTMPGYAEVKSNFTSTQCGSNTTCITTICINNEPCYTVKSNSTNSSPENEDSNSTNDGGALNQLSQIPSDSI